MELFWGALIPLQGAHGLLTAILLRSGRCVWVLLFFLAWGCKVFFFFLLSTLQSQYIVSMLGSTDWQCDGATGWMLLSG